MVDHRLEIVRIDAGVEDDFFEGCARPACGEREQTEESRGYDKGAPGDPARPGSILIMR